MKNEREMKRRTFLKGAAGLAAAGVMTGLYTWQIEPFWPEFVNVDMAIKNLPSELIGKTAIHISDMHIGERFNYQYIIDTLKKAQKLNPDFVFYTGDFVTYENEHQIKQLKEVMKHAVLGSLGTFGVLGNHDYGENYCEEKVAKGIIQVLENSGVSILRNKKVEAAGLQIYGIDDLWAINFHPEKVMNQIQENEAAICLVHNPDVADLPIWNQYKGWILCGHTHGGQCKPPFLKPPMLPVRNKRYSAGTFDLRDGRIMYINRAIGNLWQLRFNVRPEVTIFKLLSK